MKVLCETTGAFQLVDFGQGGAVIRAQRPSVVSNSHFVSSHAAAGRVRILANVNDEATDAEFAKYVKDSDGDLKLAISSFVASFEVAEPSSKEPQPEGVVVTETQKPRRGRGRN